MTKRTMTAEGRREGNFQLEGDLSEQDCQNASLNGFPGPISRYPCST